MSANNDPLNPFPVTAYYGPKYFCDRKNEIARLISNMQNGNSTTLMSIRRIGKTGLIHHLVNQLPEGWKGVYIDIMETENLTQFLNLLATSILVNIPQKGKLLRIFTDFMKSLRPVISYDTLTGKPEVSFDVKPQEVVANIGAVLQFLEQQDFKTLIAIDEFQQILNYPESNTDAWLRSRIQQLKNVVFIFSGSQQHLMNELFASPSRPFFRSTQMMKLEKLDSQIYADFIVEKFSEHKKEISLEIVNQMLQWTNTHTFYVQQLCNRVFAATAKKVTSEIWREQAFFLLKEQETLFFTYRNMLTRAQWQLLKAIAHEGIVYQPTAKDFLNRYKLGTSATVLRSLNSLQTYELVYNEFDNQGVMYYSVYDVFFQRWTKNRL
jgi:AAA+ ATPase superfamily predicted ATPase